MPGGRQVIPAQGENVRWNFAPGPSTSRSTASDGDQDLKAYLEDVKKQIKNLPHSLANLLEVAVAYVDKSIVSSKEKISNLTTEIEVILKSLDLKNTDLDEMIEQQEQGQLQFGKFNLLSETLKNTKACLV